ncbi:hypothetical protein B7988_06780 [Fibrobacter sp. UWB1]|nr:hypothetical protein B7988_06780 [Fibrobacter sp. UWB1]
MEDPMKRVLFCLLALAAFAAANTCTKAWYEIHAFNFLSIKDAPHLDSIYYREQPAPEEVHEWYQKYYYKDGLIHHSVFKFRDNDPVDNRIYLSADEATLTRSGRELLLSDSVAGDTVYFFQKMYNSGELVQTVVHKLTDLYASEQDYDPASGRRTFAEYFFRNDTLVSRTVYDYGSGMRDSAYYYYVGVPGDEYKCAEYRGDSLTNNLTYKKLATGFSVAIFNDTFLREFVMEVPEVHTTAVQRRDDAQKLREQSAAQSKRRPAKISPRARYFDLLGRYKRAKIR